MLLGDIFYKNLKFCLCFLDKCVIFYLSRILMSTVGLLTDRKMKQTLTAVILWLNLGTKTATGRSLT